MPPRPRALALALFAATTVVTVVSVALPGALASGSASAAPAVGATGNDPRPFPRTFHIWGGQPSRYSHYDLVIGYPAWDLASLRAANPGAIYLVNPMLDPFNSDWRLRKGVAVTYGAMNTFTGATDTVSDGSAANLGSIPGWNTYWDTLHRPDGSVAQINSTYKHPGWNLTRTETAEKVAKIEAYAAKLSKLYRNGWDGIWSDNWIYRIGASWFYGTDLDTDRDGVRDDMAVVSRRWWDGLSLVGQRLRSYLPGKIVGGNGVHNIAGLVGGSDPEAPYKASNITMNEVLELYTARPETVVREVQAYLAHPDPYGMARRFLLMHKLPGGASDYRSLRWGLSLATIAGAYYEPYATSHDDAFVYDEFTGGTTVNRRGWLGAPLSAPTKLPSGVWRRDFENGVVLNNSTTSSQTVVLERTYRRLSGSQAPAVNNGQTVTTVTVPPGDGLFLLSASGTVGSSPSPPTSTAPPTISGRAEVGATLTATTGTWSGSPTSYRFQWQRCDATGGSCADAWGATGSTYVLASADTGSTFRVEVTASNPSGTGVAVSSPTPVVSAPAPASSSSSQTFSVSQSVVDGQTLSGAVSWTASPSGKTIARIEFSIDGALVWTERYAPYVFGGDGKRLDTTQLANGSHLLTARAYATDGSVAAHSATVLVANTPPIASSIADGSTISGPVSWTVTVGSLSVSRVEFSIDGVLAWTERYDPYVFGGDGKLLDTRTLGRGQHTLGVKVVTTSGATHTLTLRVTVA